MQYPGTRRSQSQPSQAAPTNKELIDHICLFVHMSVYLFGYLIQPVYPCIRSLQHKQTPSELGRETRSYSPGKLTVRNRGREFVALSEPEQDICQGFSLPKGVVYRMLPRWIAGETAYPEFRVEGHTGYWVDGSGAEWKLDYPGVDFNQPSSGSHTMTRTGRHLRSCESEVIAAPWACLQLSCSEIFRICGILENRTGPVSQYWSRQQAFQADRVCNFRHTQISGRSFVP